MAQTFDIRFARSAGFAALLEMPLNQFRWKGGGQLRIDAQGISIGVKRGLLALFGAKDTQRISNENLRSVYREGEALHVEYETEKSTRVVLPFWAGDSDTAAEIVRMLPTSQTVEIEHSTGATPGKSRADWRVLLTIGIAVAASAVAVLAFYSRATSPLPAVSVAPAAQVMPDAVAAQPVENAAPSEKADEVPLADTYPPLPTRAEAVKREASASLPVPRTRFPAGAITPFADGTLERDIAVRQLALFDRDAAVLEFEYLDAHRLLLTGGLSPGDFADTLEALEMRWWEVTFRIYDSAQLEQPAMLDFRRTMLGAARRWRNFLGDFAEGLRDRDHLRISNAFGEVARAQEMRARARLFVLR